MQACQVFTQQVTHTYIIIQAEAKINNKKTGTAKNLWNKGGHLRGNCARVIVSIIIMNHEPR